MDFEQILVVSALFGYTMGPSRQTNIPVVYVRHRPETTLLYQVIREYWPEFQAELIRHDKSQPAVMTKVLAIVYRAIATHLTHKAGYTKTSAQTGAVTLIQRFGSALNLNIHFHMLFLDGVYSSHGLRFRRVKAPSSNELTQLTHTIAKRIGRFLEHQGLLERDAEDSYLTLASDDEGPMDHLLGSSVTYRIAVGPQQGRKVFTLQSLPDCTIDHPAANRLGEAAGFSLHAGVATRAHERAKLERLCRYITRPALSTKRLSLTRNGNLRYELKTPWRNGTTHIIFEPLDFIARLGKGKKVQAPDQAQDQTPAEKRASMTWAKRLKRVFNIDIGRSRTSCPSRHRHILVP